jgi:TonB family protein
VRSKTVIFSAVLHIIVFGAAFQISKKSQARRRTSVAVVGEKKKKAPEKKPEDKPKPKPKVLASAKPEADRPLPTTAKSTAPTPEPTAPTSAAVDTGLTLGNSDGPGIDVGGPAKPVQKGPQQNAANDQKAGPATKKEKALVPKGSPEEDDCTEAPSKPSPAQRPTEIEYTQEARANGVEGRLVLKITVGADGSVANVEVVSPVDPALDAAAISAVKTWTFKPAMRCGKAMGGAVFTLARRFELGD